MALTRYSNTTSATIRVAHIVRRDRYRSRAQSRAPSLTARDVVVVVVSCSAPDRDNFPASPQGRKGS
eukprot:4409686-Pleurochrysis_carterae.AAC.2